MRIKCKTLEIMDYHHSREAVPSGFEVARRGSKVSALRVAEWLQLSGRHEALNFGFCKFSRSWQRGPSAKPADGDY